MEYSTNSILSLISHLHTVSADFTNRRLADTAGLVSSHGYILYLLSQHQKLSMKELADGINRDKSTTTVLIRKLREVMMKLHRFLQLSVILIWLSLVEVPV